jgi:hypothetical protein
MGGQSPYPAADRHERRDDAGDQPQVHSPACRCGSPEPVFDTSRKDKHWVKREIKEGLMTDGRHPLVIVAW